VRERAINALLREPDPSLKPLIEAARSKESDPGLKNRLDQLWALTALQDPDAAMRLEAVQLIGQRKDPQMRGLLLPLVEKNKDQNYAETDPKVRAAAEDALKAMAFEQWKTEMVGTLFAGLSLGSILLLAALGLAITYGLIGVINMAHGEFLMIGAYATYMVQEFFRRNLSGAFDWYPIAAIPVAFRATMGIAATWRTSRSSSSLRQTAGDTAFHIWRQLSLDSGGTNAVWRSKRPGFESFLDERGRCGYAELDFAVQPDRHHDICAGGRRHRVTCAQSYPAWTLYSGNDTKSQDGGLLRHTHLASG
jgi:hypothetical protein